MNRKQQRGDVLSLILYGLVIVGALAAIGGAWAMFTGHFAEQGRAEVRAQHAPLLEQCATVMGKAATPSDCAVAWQTAISNARTAAANLAGCQEASKMQSDAILAADKRTLAARAETMKILAAREAATRAMRAEVDQLVKIAATPAATRKEACDEADSVLRDLSSRRLRFDSGRAADPAGSNGDGAGSGAGALRVGK